MPFLKGLCIGSLAFGVVVCEVAEPGSGRASGTAKSLGALSSRGSDTGHNE